MTALEAGRSQSVLAHFTTAGVLFLTACGGGSTTNNTGGNGGGTETMTPASPSGDAQQGNPNSALPDPFRIVITKAGAPVSGKTVTWTVTAGGGTVSPGSAVTGSDGIASTLATLGTADLTVAASADGVAGSPVTFTAGVIGLNAEVTVQNTSFTPQIVFVKVGGSVTFTWTNSARNHTVTPDDGKLIPASPDQPTPHDGPFSFSATFNATGDYYYHCAIHGSTRGGMFGKVTVVP